MRQVCKSTPRHATAPCPMIMLCCDRAACAASCTGTLPEGMSSLKTLSYISVNSPRRTSLTLVGTLPAGYSELTALTFLSLDHQL